MRKTEHAKTTVAFEPVQKNIYLNSEYILTLSNKKIKKIKNYITF